MLKINNLSVAYGKHQALNEVSLEVSPGEIVVILGANGAGKSSLLKSISGICEGSVSGQVIHDGIELQSLSSDEIVSHGVALVPEGRGIFPELSVIENLKLGAYSNEARADAQENLERVLQLFPILDERQRQRAGTMSGGEQQMVAIGRAMMSNPKILTLDEPSLGLSPLLTKELFQNLKHVKSFGLGILMVEQNARQSLAIADRGYLLENTKIVKQDSASLLLSDPEVQAVYLGGGGDSSTAKVGSHSPKSPEQTDASLPHMEIEFESIEPKSADRILGCSIADIVNLASSISKEAFSHNASPLLRSETQSSGQVSPSSHQIETIYKDIEQAAQKALNCSCISKNSETQNFIRESTHTEIRYTPEKDSEAPVKIEVYRPARVEIYRRQGKRGQFAKEES